MWNLEKVFPKTYHINFKTQKDLGMFFLRLQEFYEDDFFQDEFFTIERFKEFYKEEYGGGEFTYFSDWQGYNICSEQMRSCVKYYKPHLSKLSHKEKESILMVDFLSRIEDGKWLLIGTCGKNHEQKITLNHELAHAIYFFDKNYNKNVKKLMREMPSSIMKKSYDFLKGVGYDNENIVDELNAYWSTGCTYEELEIPLKHAKKFEELFLTAKQKTKGK